MKRQRQAVSILEILILGAIGVAVTVPAIGLLLSSRQGIAASYNEVVARNLAAEALEWGAALPTDGLRGNVTFEETPLGQYPQARLEDGLALADGAFRYDNYRYPQSHTRFLRSLEVVDVSPRDTVPLLRLTAVVAWAEQGSGTGRVRTVQLSRVMGP